MSNSKKDKSSRRKFLALGLLGTAGLVAGDAAAQTPEDAGDTVKMLTPDGQLVEVSKSFLEKSTARSKAKNEEILNWTKTVK